ncbi:hypothetical protein FIBSPDRAFT_876377 [Athelia psychrophila]|uniref:Uncharacterized protein n=1 Tax=Athelia psychrophila TaxID=1759441 RepID=A0A167WXQ7_9AGAM|nr:hypothetical protein FIBSPDRAFT_876377 [Fibularhizoctonia sp. CBS 109695]
MSLTLSPVDTFCVSLPTLKGLVDIILNLTAIVDWLSVHHRLLFVASGVLLWVYPAIFTWPVLPFKYTCLWILYGLGFEKGQIRPDSYPTQYQRHYYGGTIPQYSTFSNFQAAAVLQVRIEPEEAPPLYAKVLGWIAGILAVRAFFI